jgi:hypothetical protein
MVAHNAHMTEARGLRQRSLPCEGISLRFVFSGQKKDDVTSCQNNVQAQVPGMTGMRLVICASLMSLS